MIEPLEPRIAPAGIIDLKLTNGLLTAKTLAAGDGEEDVVISQILDGELRVDPAPGTRVKFQGQLLADGELINIPGVTGLSVSLGAGNDTLTIVNARLTKSLLVNLGTGANSLTLTNADVSGALTVIGGPSADTITLGGATNFAVGTKATFSLGGGNNVFSSTVPFFGVGRDFVLTAGPDDDFITWNADKFSVGGNFSAVTGDGADTVEIMAMEDAFFARNVTMTSANTDLAATVKQRIISAASLDIGGNVKFTVKSGDVAQELQADTGALYAGGSVSLKTGVGKSNQRVDTAASLAISGNFAVSTKAVTTADVVVIARNFPQGSLVGGSVTLLGHKSVQYLTGTNITGAMTITTAAGQAATVALGVNLGEGVRIGGNLTITTSEPMAGTSNVTVTDITVGGMFKLIGKAGTTNAVLNDTQFLGRVMADLGAGNDFFRLETLGTSGTTVFYAPVTLRGGDGADTFQVSGATGADVLTFRSTTVLDGGAGTDTFMQGNAPTTAVPITQVNIP